MVKMNNRFFLTFGAGTTEIEAAAKRLQRQAASTLYFEDCFRFEAANLPDVFWGKYPREWSLKRGYGYWAWKPFSILLTLTRSLSEGDFILYADAGCELNDKGLERLDIYFREAEQNRGFFAFEQPYVHQEWCKRELMEKLPVPSGSRQLSATVLIFQKGTAGEELLKAWWELASLDSGKLLEDSLEPDSEHPEFVEHRHDQAILHALAIRSGFKLYQPDESYQTPWHENKHLPILACRNKSGVSALPRLIGPLPVRLLEELKLLSRNVVRKVRATPKFRSSTF